MSERDSFRKTAAQFEEFARDTEVPPAMRDLAERNIAQMRETYAPLHHTHGARATFAAILIQINFPLANHARRLSCSAAIRIVHCPRERLQHD